VADEVETQLKWERHRRPAMALAAVAAGLLPLVAGVANAVVYNRAPRASLLTSLERAFAPGPIAELPSLHVPLYEFYRDNFPLLLAIAALNAIGLLTTGAVLTFLGRATRARRPAFRAWVAYLPLAAATVFALAGLGLVVATNVAVSALLDGPRTVSAVSDWQGGIITAGRTLESLARLLLGVGFVLVSLNAMRTGLLTRFMGALGVVSGRSAGASDRGTAADRSGVLADCRRHLDRRALSRRRPAGLADGPRRAVAEPAGAARGARGGRERRPGGARRARRAATPARSRRPGGRRRCGRSPRAPRAAASGEAALIPAGVRRAAPTASLHYNFAATGRREGTACRTLA
jgi:hypothetical protein